MNKLLCVDEGKAIRKLLLLLISIQFFGCHSQNDAAAVRSYPLLALFDAAKTLEGERVEVVGYFGFWEKDIPVLYASHTDFEVKDGIYKSHIIFSNRVDMPKMEEMKGKVCFFKASIWYRGTVPTLDQADLIKCAD